MKGSKYWAGFVLMGFLVLISAYLFSGCAMLNRSGHKTGDKNQTQTDVGDEDQNSSETGSHEVKIDGMAINDQACSAAGEKVTFTILIHNAPNTVNALGFQFIYDENVLEYEGYERGDLTKGFEMFDLHHTKGDTLRCGGIIINGEIASGSSGTVAEITFTIKKCKPVSLRLSDLTDDVEGWPVQDGQFTVYEDVPESEESEAMEEEVYLQQTEEAGAIGGGIVKERAIEEEIPSAQALERQPEGSKMVRTLSSGDKADDTHSDSYSATNIGSATEGNMGSGDRDASDGMRQPARFAAEREVATAEDSVEKSQRGAVKVLALGNKTTGGYRSPSSNDQVNDKDDASAQHFQPEEKIQPKPYVPPSYVPPSYVPPADVPPADDPPADDPPEGGGFLIIDSQPCSAAGEEVTFAVSIEDSPNKLESLGFDVIYDKSILKYKEYSRGELTQNFTVFDVVQLPANALRIGGVNIAGNIEQGAAGVLVKLTFDVIECEPATLNLSRLMDSLKGCSPIDGQLNADGLR